MLFDTSYKDKKIEKQIEDAVGPAFSFKERWKLGGIGSERLTITNIADEYSKYLNASHYQSKANIELRPKGIILHFRHKLQAYSWIMPFESLKLENKVQLALKSNNKYVVFKEKIEDVFLQKLIKVRGNP